MSNLHAAFRSDSLQTTDEVHYRITHHSQTEQRVNWQDLKEDVMDGRSRDYTTGKKLTGGRPTQSECRSPPGIPYSNAKRAIHGWNRKGEHGVTERKP